MKAVVYNPRSTKIVKNGRMTESEYRAIHMWIGRKLGKPSKCESCGETSDSIRYDWANTSGEYKKDVSDWKRLCHKCHIRTDFKKDFCKQGHKMTPENTYIRTRGGSALHRVCKSCKRISRAKHSAKKKALKEKIK